ncbi:acyltransferase family protein [Parvibaculum sp.]|uniref:acyltransferase family protein n=1 Tax=Parvibaculum sp. TaxID=2024848 RepID=UPI002730F116|nr:acyltransferase family protein [Parvibaculum sp.]MDP1625725.1 acyltransferase family protein [Parvibaculum sp.]MDP2149088.1 acyltransferase family protein [Parvibaculum sp.]MDP3328373.1 acyltransferase family protein [Parvibaculum sp.]
MAGASTSVVSKQRINWIDTAKGLTIILVVMEHTTFGVSNAIGHMPLVFGAIAEFAKPFRMPLFFLVAGLFAYKALFGDLRKFVDGKIVHFAYFYVLWSVIQIGIKMIPHEGAWQVTYVDLLMIPIQPFAVLWFIYSLAMFFVTMRLLREARPFFVFFFALALYFTRLDTGWMLLDEFAWRFIWFVTGVYGAKQIFQIADWARVYPAKSAGLAGLMLACVGTVVFSHLVDIRALELLMGFAGAGSAIMLVSLLASRGLAGPIAYVGRHSLYVFLTFFLPMATMRIVLTRLGLDNGDLITLISTTIAVVTPILAFRLVENTPLGFAFVRPDMFRLTTPRARKPNIVMAAGGD